MRKVAWLCAIAAVLGLQACGSSDNPASPTPYASRSPAAEVTPASTAATANITGFGATDDVWNRQHKEDTTQDPGSAYDPQPDGTDKFQFVDHSHGRILSFSIELPDPGVTAEEARAESLSLLPADATLVYDLTKDACELLQYQSPTVAAVLSDPMIDDAQGLVDVGFISADYPEGYDASRVNTISFALGRPDDAGTACS